MPNAFTLKTEAITWSPPRGETRRKATVEFRGARPVLVIEDTPGQWFLSTLIGCDSYNGFAIRRPHEQISIDFGQHWVCTNLRELVSEALARVLGEDPSR